MLHYATKKKAIVVHSGGMDSSICLALAIRKVGADAVLSLGFDYGHRHAVNELAAAARICRAWNVDRRVIDLSLLGTLAEDALVNKSLTIQGNNTLVVGRNGLMTRLAAIHAHALGVEEIYLGVIERDAAETGYRDCSRSYFDLKEQILRQDLGNEHFSILTPLVKMTKMQTLQQAEKLGVLDFLLQETVTCYDGLSGPGCRKCLACRLKNEGIRQFEEAKC